MILYSEGVFRIHRIGLFLHRRGADYRQLSLFPHFATVDGDRQWAYLRQWDTSPQREAFYLEG
jgi:hypothetical protein